MAGEFSRRRAVAAGAVLLLTAVSVAAPAIGAFAIAVSAALTWCWLLDSRRDP